MRESRLKRRNLDMILFPQRVCVKDNREFLFEQKRPAAILTPRLSGQK
jgi:hypothetical protein